MTDVRDQLGLGQLPDREVAAPAGASRLPVGLPMPRDAALLGESYQRVQVSHFTEPRYPFPVPNDWFVVAEAEDLAPGEVQALDIPIWENNIYRDPPVITKTEKLILEHRRWSKQFYSGMEDEA